MPALAGLSDLKLLLATTETAQDALLLLLLDQATAVAERVAGRPLTREQGVTEYPAGIRGRRDRLRVARYPIESVTGVKQLYGAGTDADFTSTTPLVQAVDYAVQAATGILDRVGTSWVTGPRYIQVVYTGGYVDPARVEIGLATATWTAATRTLTEVGAFASYTFAPGDAIVVTGGTGATPGTYRIASRIDNDSITLEAPVATGDLSGGDITSGYLGMVPPPLDIQRGILNQAERMWQLRGSAGLTGINLGSGASVGVSDAEPHPSLKQATAALRYYP